MYVSHPHPNLYPADCLCYNQVLNFFCHNETDHELGIQDQKCVSHITTVGESSSPVHHPLIIVVIIIIISISISIIIIPTAATTTTIIIMFSLCHNETN